MDLTLISIEWAATLAFLAGGGWWALRNLGTKIDEQTKHMNARFDGLQKKDDDHDRRLNEHHGRLIAVEKDVDHQKGRLGEILDRVNAIYESIIGERK